MKSQRLAIFLFWAVCALIWGALYSAFPLFAGLAVTPLGWIVGGGFSMFVLVSIICEG